MIHPPMLYMGYVGFSVAFSFAVAALIGGNLDATWARWTRPWTTAAWIFLTIGIALGSGWAYYELGWGGWWFWDPVENASFMPWLVGTALIHSLAVTEKRGGFKIVDRAAGDPRLLAARCSAPSWCAPACCRRCTPSPPIRGAASSSSPSSCIVIGASLALYAWRAPTVGLGARFALLSREIAAARQQRAARRRLRRGPARHALPARARRAGHGQDLGRPALLRHACSCRCMTPLVFLMGVGPLARWKQAELPDLARAAASWAAGARGRRDARSSPWLRGGIGIVAATLGLLMAFWIVASVATDLVERAAVRRRRAREHRCTAPARFRARWSACMVAHLRRRRLHPRRDAW